MKNEESENRFSSGLKGLPFFDTIVVTDASSALGQEEKGEKNVDNGYDACKWWRGIENFIEQVAEKAGYDQNAQWFNPFEADDSSIVGRKTVEEFSTTVHQFSLLTPGPLAVLLPPMPGVISICRGIRSLSAPTWEITPISLLSSRS